MHCCGLANMWPTTVWRVTDLIKRRETSSCGVNRASAASRSVSRVRPHWPRRCRLALALDGGVMPIQGPPGSGKTYTGARMITEMVNAGLRVGVTANSHKVIRNLLDEVGRAADEIGIDLTCIQKVPEEATDEPRLRFTTDNATCLSALR